MKLSRIGLLLALPACAASGLSPSTAWAGKFARAAERVQAVVPESLKPAPASAAPAGTDDPAFPISVAPAPLDHHEGMTTPRLVDAARPRPKPDALSTPDVSPEVEATPTPAPALTPAAVAGSATPPTADLSPGASPPAYSRYAPPPASAAAAPTPTGHEPNRLPTSAPPASAPAGSLPDAASLEALAHKRAVADPNQSTAAAPQLLTPGTNSDGMRPVLVTPGAATTAPEHAFGHNSLRDSSAPAPAIYRNVLRDGPDDADGGTNSDIEQTAGRRRLNSLPNVVSAAANPAAGRSVGGNAAAGTSAAGKGPVRQSATPASPAQGGVGAAATGPSKATATPSTVGPATAPTRAAVTSPRVGAAASPATIPPRGTAYAGDDREPGSLDKKSVIGTEPADRKSQQMFESETQPQALTAELELLRKRVQTALAYYYQNWTLNTREHSPWEVMHAIIAYGVDTRLAKGSPNGERMTAIGHLCFSGISNNQPILTLREGKLYALRGPGVQGHSGQFLAILAQSYLQRDYPLYVGGQKYTLEDLIRAEQEDCESGTELTFKLIGLMHYLPSDATWTNFQGQTWSLDRLVREEIVQPIRGAACGGTHRLMGLSYAIRKREQRGEPIDGIYLEARKYIDQYHKYTFSLQNRDGSFSTAWFVRPEARNDLDRRMQTTGHVLEWLCFSLTDEQLRDPRVVRAVRYITDQLLNQGVSQWEIGHLGHALHALQIYNERVFGGPVRSFEGLVRRPTKTAVRTPGTAR